MPANQEEKNGPRPGCPILLFCRERQRPRWLENGMPMVRRSRLPHWLSHSPCRRGRRRSRRIENSPPQAIARKQQDWASCPLHHHASLGGGVSGPAGTRESTSIDAAALPTRTSSARPVGCARCIARADCHSCGRLCEKTLRSDDGASGDPSPPKSVSAIFKHIAHGRSPLKVSTTP